jgi:hypothetical protein
MKIAVLTANLGKFDSNTDPVKQDTDFTFHRWTDDNFPPIIGVTPRMQYRIPKMFGWQMFPGYDYYIWLDGSMSLQHEHSVKFFVDRCLDYDIAVFKHPWRNTIQEEVNHIEDYLKKDNQYMVSRYKNGLHKEQYIDISRETAYIDDKLYASTAFIYKNTPIVRSALINWWTLTTRYFTCDQVALPYVLWKNRLKVNVIKKDIFNIPYITLTSKHK